MTARAIARSPGAAGPLLEPETPWDWTLLAECQYTDPELFFPEGPDAITVTTSARRVCLGCPVRAECLRHALAQPELHGTWGGLPEGELRQERDLVPVRPVAEILAAADERYFRRHDRRVEAHDRVLAAYRERRAEAAARMGLVA